MANGLTDWDQMSVRDQTNQLDARIQNLAERIVDLESSRSHHTTGSRRVDRWRAIECAATDVVDTFDSPQREQALGRLRRAIEMA